MKPRDALLLGRVSNLPTVWTNVLAGLVLAGGSVTPGPFVWLAVALSLLYVGGMYLNDAFDRKWDGTHRPERPIPSGRVRARTVFTAGFGMLGLGVGMIVLDVYGRGAHPAAIPAALVLAATIVFYNAFHKANSLAPLVMGACRVLVYCTAAFTVLPALPRELLIGCAALLAWLIGLTYAARQENLARLTGAWPLALLAVPVMLGLTHMPDVAPIALAGILATWAALAVLRMRSTPPDIGDGVARLIAGISLVDALAIASQGQTELALLAVLATPLTRLAQRHIPGT